jgi:hypothetical protein
MLQYYNLEWRRRGEAISAGSPPLAPFSFSCFALLCLLRAPPSKALFGIFLTGPMSSIALSCFLHFLPLTTCILFCFSLGCFSGVQGVCREIDEGGAMLAICTSDVLFFREWRCVFSRIVSEESSCTRNCRVYFLRLLAVRQYCGLCLGVWPKGEGPLHHHDFPNSVCFDDPDQ